MHMFRTRLLPILALLAATALHAEDYAFVSIAGVGSSAGGADGTPGTFNNPYGIAIDADKNVYIADTLNHTIRKITPGRVVSTLAGTTGIFGATDGTGTGARLNFPVGIALDAGGNLYVSDARSFTIRKITPAGVVTTFAGTAFQTGAADGTGAAARFFLPYGVAVDGQGNVFVAEGGNHTIRRITPAGVVTTFAGTAGSPGFVNATGAAARFNTPFGLAVDAFGNLYVADSGNNAIRKITSTGIVTTLAGAANGAAGSLDGAGAGARFNQPRGVANGPGGSVFVADYGNSTLRQISSSGEVTTLAGSAGIVGEANSVGAAVRFYDPTGVAGDGTTVYVADTSNNLIRRGVPASSAGLPEINIQPVDQEVSVGQAVSFRVVATGSALTYQWLRNGVAVAGASASTLSIASAQAADSAVYVVRVSGPTGSKDSEAATLTVHPVNVGSIPISARPLSQSVNSGQSVTFSVTASGTGLTYQWLRNGVPVAGATNASYTIASAQVGDAGTYTVRITSGANTETPSAKLVVDASAGAPVSITSNPANRTVEVGQSASFAVAATGTGTLAYQWLKNDAPIAGATAATYTIAAVQAADAGSYSARVSVGSASVTSAAAVLTVTAGASNAGRLVNMSIRTAAGTGDNTLIVGVSLGGSGTAGAKGVLLRGVGPTLGGFGVAGALADPVMTVFQGQTQVSTNDDWDAAAGATFAGLGAFAFANGSRDSAIYNPAIPSGSYSIQIVGKGGATGIALAEIYDATAGNNFTATTPRLVNVSARTQVGTGDGILIAGFVVGGQSPVRVLVRAVGPTLAAFGVGGTLADPKLEIFSGQTKTAENDNWDAATAATFSSVGAFAFTAGSRDAALVATLQPGSYTAQVSGVGGTTGVALVEVYELP